MKEMIPSRLICYTADLRLLTGKSDRTCQRLMQQIREELGLAKHQQVTFYHICEYLDLTIEQLLPFIK